MKTMTGVKWFASITFLCGVVPILLNGGLPEEGTFSQFLVMYGGGLFMCVAGWYMGCVIRNTIAAPKVETCKLQLIESGCCETFYKEYCEKSHLNKHQSAQYAPEAIRRLIELGYSKNQITLDISHAVVNYDFESTEALVKHIVNKYVKDMLKV